MKIGIDISALSARPTGTGRYVETLLEKLNNSEHKIITFTPGEGEIRNSVFKKLPFISRGGFRRHSYFWFSVKNEMMREEIDAAIFPNYFLPRSFQKPAVVIIHDLSFLSHPHFYSKVFVKYYKLLLKQTLNQNPVIVTISNHSKDKIHEYLGIPKANIFLLQSYSRLNGQLSSGKNGHKPYFLYVGHVEPRKNLNFLIKNFLRWNEKNNSGFKLVIAGETWIRSREVKDMIRSSGSHPEIEFKGFVDDASLHSLYNNASAFVHTSFEEGFGLPVLEAMHYRLPILCSSGTATEEISSPDSVLVNPYDDLSCQKGFDVLYQKLNGTSGIDYDIKYSPVLMQKQLEEILSALESHVKRVIGINVTKAVQATEAVKKTLLYASLFNSGIKKDDLLKNLFDIKSNEGEIGIAIQSLQCEDKILVNGDYIYLKNSRYKYYDKRKLQIGRRRFSQLMNMLNKIPFTSAIAFSGGSANYYEEDHDDIDLFIITKPNTVFIVYFIIHLLSLMFKARNQICVNHMIDETNLVVNSPGDFFVAHQIISLKPFKNELMISRFQNQNEWLNEFFPNFKLKTTSDIKSSKLYGLFIPINKILKYFYRTLYREKLLRYGKEGSLKLSDNILKLHTNDHRARISLLFDEAWNDYMRIYKSNESARNTGNEINPDKKIAALK